MIALKNNAQSLLALPASSSQTTINISLGDGGKFPDLSNGDNFRCALKDNAGNIEFINVTGRSGDIFTIERGQEGSTAKTWPVGTRVQLRMTQKTWEEMAGYHMKRMRGDNGDLLIPTRISDTQYSIEGNVTSIFEPSRSLIVYEQDGTTHFGYISNATYATGSTTVTVEDMTLPSVISMLEIGVPLRCIPKNSTSVPVAHLIDENAHYNIINPISTTLAELSAKISDITGENGKISRGIMPIATKSDIGSVVVGHGLSVTTEGTLSVQESSLSAIPESTHSVTADNATQAANANTLAGKSESQLNVNYAASANYAASSGYAGSSGSATNATNATYATCIHSDSCVFGGNAPSYGGVWAYVGTVTSGVGTDASSSHFAIGKCNAGAKIGESFSGLFFRIS